METVTFALTPHTSAIIVQRRRYVDAILRPMETKKQLRSRVLARRDALPEEVRARKSAAICARLEQVLAEALAGAEGAGTAQVSAEGTSRADATGGSAVPTVAVFASMRSEVDTRPFVEAAYARGWDVCFPCMVRDEADGQGPGRMAFYRVPGARLDHARAAFLDHPLRCLPCAALADAGYEKAAPADLDAVAVPLVAFDDEGNRLGYGGGNYDRLLPRLRADALVVGVAFDEQRVPAVPCEPHDRPLARIVHA